jgi:hypothetical protein
MSAWRQQRNESQEKRARLDIVWQEGQHLVRLSQGAAVSEVEAVKQLEGLLLRIFSNWRPAHLQLLTWVIYLPPHLLPHVQMWRANSLMAGVKAAGSLANQ